MAGLDPAIHGVPSPPALAAGVHGYVTRHRVDARVEPGHDGRAPMTPPRILENSILRRRRHELVIGAVLLVALIALPLPISDVTTLNIMILTMLYAGLAQAWNILGGYCGQISLGHALYFGVGGYVSTLLFVQAGIPPTLGMLAGGAIAALCALLVGWPCFRLTGHYYAIATVVVGELGYLLFQNWDFVGGDSGVYVPITVNSWVTLQFGKHKLPYYFVMLGFAVLTWAVAWWVEGSRLGFSWRAVKDDVIAARSLGVRIFPSKMAAAALSGFFTGMGGAIYAQYVGYIDPDSMLSSPLSILIALPAVLGGVGTLWGPIIGAAILIPVSELSRSYLGGSGRGVDLMLYGLLIVVVALARPQGLVSLLGLMRPRAKVGGADARPA
jgi:branched-chain amino acid transport system permease protein